MEPTFKLIATGIQPNLDSEIVRKRFGELIQGDFSEIEKIFHRIRTKDPVVLAEDIPQEKSGNLLKKLNEIGLICRLEPMQLMLVPIDTVDENTPPYLCPACGHKQPPKPDGSDICERCGVVGRNYEAVSEYKMALNAERERLRTIVNREKMEKLNKAKERSQRIQEKLQEDMIERARRQAEKELSITLWDKIRERLRVKPHFFIPIFSSVVLIAAGIGFLVWKMEIPDSQNVAANTASGTPSKLQIQITPPPGLEVTVAGSEARLAQDTSNGTNSALPGASPSAGATNVASPGKGSTQLISFNKVALDSSASTKTPNTAQTIAATGRLHLLIALARYQVETGDLTAAVQSLEHVNTLLEEVKRSDPKTTLPDTINRNRAEILATIAYRYHKKKESLPAQTQWHESMELANAIVAPNERAQAFASIGRTLQETTPATADSYLNRAIDSAQALKDPAIRSITLSAIASDLSNIGQNQQAKALFAQAATDIPAITDTDKRLAVQCAVAKYYAEAGDNAPAQELLKQIPGRSKKADVLLECDYQQASARSAIARNLARSGDALNAQKEFTAVLDQTVRFQDTETRARAMLYLARSLVEAGDSESAARIAAVAIHDSGVDSSGNSKVTTR
ncbi:MAG: hypothetical protein IAF00_12750 [Phycisphaerales bacterium]|nr:hypothetical protein [Phycisphaerales bacterium]